MPAAQGKETWMSKQMPRLGRGLSSLISRSVEPAAVEEPAVAHSYVPAARPPAVADQAQPPVAGTIAVPASAASQDHPGSIAAGAVEIPISLITPNPYQPRREFDIEQLNELAASIAQQGVLQPLIVASASEPNVGKSFVLIAGERRLRAARLAGLASVPCVVREAGPRQMLEWALVENIQRSDLNPVERASAYRDFMDRFHLTQAEAAERLGQPRATVANYLRILDLCDEVQRMLVIGHLSFGHAKVLASLASQVDRQQTLARKAIAESLSVRQLENLVAAMGLPRQARKARAGSAKPPYLLDLEEQLTRTVGTKVAISPGKGKHNGKIAIEYYSLDDFDRITALLGLKVES